MLTQTITLTKNAQDRIESVLRESADSSFRVFVTGGGCSGFQYGFKSDNDVSFDDDVISYDNFEILVDSMSYAYILGSKLDFVEDLSGAKFVIDNPNAKTTCGCGESFTV